MKVDDLAQEIRRVDGERSLGAGALAAALLPFILSYEVAKPAAETSQSGEADLIQHRLRIKPQPSDSWTELEEFTEWRNGPHGMSADFAAGFDIEERSLFATPPAPATVEMGEGAVGWNTSAEWELAQQAFHAAGRADVPEDVQRLVAILWEQYCIAAALGLPPEKWPSLK